MPYKDKDAGRKWNRERNARIRAEWLDGKRCATWWCGNTENLEADHIDPKQKVSSAVWSWTEERREAELVKCQVLCRPCHVAKSVAEGSMIPFANGEENPAAKLTEETVLTIRRMVAEGVKQKTVAEILDIPKQTVNNIVKRNSWKHV